MAKQVSRYNAQFTGDDKNLQDTLKRISTGVDRTASKLSFTNVATGISAAIDIIETFGSKLSGVFSHGIDLAKDFEQSTTAFTTFLGGSRDLADELLGDLRNLSTATPFQLPELIGGAKGLLAFGVDRESVIGELTALGDIASGSGSRINELVSIYGKVRSAGVAYLGDINQLGDRAIPIYAALEKTTGRTGEALRKFISSGGLSFEAFRAALVSTREEGGLFFGAMETQSATLAGRLSTLSDTFDNVFLTLGTAVAPIIKQFTDGLIPAIDELGAKLEGLEFNITKQDVQDAVTAGGITIDALTTTKDALLFLTTGISQGSARLEKALGIGSQSTIDALDAIQRDRIRALKEGLGLGDAFRDAFESASKEGQGRNRIVLPFEAKPILEDPFAISKEIADVFAPLTDTERARNFGQSLLNAVKEVNLNQVLLDTVSPSRVLGEKFAGLFAPLADKFAEDPLGTDQDLFKQPKFLERASELLEKIKGFTFKDLGKGLADASELLVDGVATATQEGLKLVGGLGGLSFSAGAGALQQGTAEAFSAANNNRNELSQLIRRAAEGNELGKKQLGVLERIAQKGAELFSI